MTVEVDVEYCGTCGYQNKFQELSEYFQQHKPNTKLSGHIGRGGSFEVKVNSTLVHSKLSTLAFPDYDDLINITNEAEDGQELRLCKQQPITNCCVSMQYAITLWGHSSHVLPIFRMQKKAVRVMLGLNQRLSCRPHFQDLHILPLPSVYMLNHLVDIHKDQLQFDKASDVHQHDMRLSEPLEPKDKSKANSYDIELYNLPE